MLREAHNILVRGRTRVHLRLRYYVAIGVTVIVLPETWPALDNWLAGDIVEILASIGATRFDYSNSVKFRIAGILRVLKSARRSFLNIDLAWQIA